MWESTAGVMLRRRCASRACFVARGARRVGNSQSPMSLPGRVDADAAIHTAMHTSQLAMMERASTCIARSTILERCACTAAQRAPAAAAPQVPPTTCMHAHWQHTAATHARVKSSGTWEAAWAPPTPTLTSGRVVFATARFCSTGVALNTPVAYTMYAIAKLPTRLPA